ncbi:MAG: hypothetical protein IK092_05900, partial [Muribaculaceae bacterium]|nr:hypothetical protein [Muribaculaceae bacterium]
ENYPNFQLQAGASHMYGEFARAKLMLGGGNGFGLVLYGGMGKEFIFNVKNEKMLDHYSGHKRTPWHAGLGAFLITDEYDNSSDLTFGITFTESPAVTNNALMLDLTWSKYFGENRRFGVFIGAGGGLGDMRDEDGKFMWDVNIGIAFKLWKN